MSAPPTLYCSFCGKSQHEVQQLIAGPVASICDECVDLCTAKIAEIRAPSMALVAKTIVDRTPPGEAA